MKTVATLLVFFSLTLAPDRSEAQWKFGGSTGLYLPIGDVADISQVGMSFDIFGGTRLGRRSSWALEANTGIHWFLPFTLLESEVPDWVESPDPDFDGQVSMSGTFIPLRASITKFFGRYYFSPRVGVYIPTGDFTREAGMSTSFGVAPRIGYFFPVARSVQFDMAVEYNYQFSDLATIQYLGFSMGFFFGGERMRSRRFQ